MAHRMRLLMLIFLSVAVTISSEFATGKSIAPHIRSTKLLTRREKKKKAGVRVKQASVAPDSMQSTPANDHHNQSRLSFEKSGASAIPDSSGQSFKKAEQQQTAAKITNRYVGVAFILLLSFAFSQATKTSLNPRPTDCWTGFRAFLATWIFLGHCEIINIPGSGAFFVLSGAVLSLDSSAKHMSSIRGYFCFQVMRLGRIIPAYWMALALSSAHTPHAFIENLVALPHNKPADFLAVETWHGTPPPGNLWFVSAITMMYLVFPFMSMLWNRIGTREHLSRCAVVFCAAYALQWMLCLFLVATPPAFSPDQCKHYPRNILGWKVLAYSTPICRIPEFVLGCMVTHAMTALSDGNVDVATPIGSADSSVQSPRAQRRELALACITDAAAILLIGAACASRTYVGHYGDRSDCGQFLTIGAMMNLMSPLWCLWLFGMAYGPSSSCSRRILQSRLALAIGGSSYGIYLYSFTCRAFIKDNFVAYLASVSLAIFSFYLVEQPISLFIKRSLQEGSGRA